MIAAVITREGQILYSKLNNIGEQEAVDVEPIGTALGAAFEPTALEPTPTLGVPVVGVSANHRGFIERLGSSYLGFTDPFEHMVAIDPDAVTVAEWYNNAHIGRGEFPWQDFGSPEQLKNFHEFRFTIERAGRAYLGIYVETDANTKTADARRAYCWKGLVFNKDVIRVPFNRAGRKIRVRFVAVLFNGGRLLIRDAEIGLSVGGTD